MGKLVTDEDFAEVFFADPAKAIVRIGVELTAEESDALRHISRVALHEFSSKIDDRICKLHLDQESEVSA